MCEVTFIERHGSYKVGVDSIVFIMQQSIGKGKAVPLRAWSGPEGSRKLRFPDYVTTAQDCGKVVTFTPQEMLLVLISVRG
jgi:hypothetical protein